MLPSRGLQGKHSVTRKGKALNTNDSRKLKESSWTNMKPDEKQTYIYATVHWRFVDFFFFFFKWVRFQFIPREIFPDRRTMQACFCYSQQQFALLRLNSHRSTLITPAYMEKIQNIHSYSNPHTSHQP